jgi:hypothetical protein
LLRNRTGIIRMFWSFTNGSGTHEIDFDVFIQPGSMFFLQPGQMHHWNLSDDVEGFVIFYSQEMYNLYFTKKQSPTIHFILRWTINRKWF